MSLAVKKLKLGTRRSLLAWAQSSWVAREVEKLNPGVSVELVGIETRGDKIQHIPLQKVEGKDFFVAELDHALQDERVDFTVHSMKDLSLTRPEAFVCAAVPPRENPRDIILFGPKTLDRLKAGKTLKIGTSSPRRLENIPTFLTRALPQISGQISGKTDAPQLSWIEIRGNVNTRLSRVHEQENSEKYLDGVVLAFAGLIRLWADEPGRAELKRLLQGVRWMVLPLKVCPAAPAQGALAVECRKNDAETRKILSVLHSPDSEKQARRERALLGEWGGGCHQRFGATAIQHPELGELFYARGAKQNGEFVECLEWDAPQASQSGKDIQAWDGGAWRKSANRAASLSSEQDPSNPIELDPKVLDRLQQGAAVFVAHSRAWNEKIDGTQGVRVWSSGIASWVELAKAGVWVEGCAENLGYQFLRSTLKEPVLQLPEESSWLVFTHERALSEWQEMKMKAVPVYRLNLNYGSDSKSALREASHVFWSSGSQFDELKENLPAQIHHACGPGKTAEHLRQAGIQPSVFPSVEEWKKWLKLGN